MNPADKPLAQTIITGSQEIEVRFREPQQPGGNIVAVVKVILVPLSRIGEYIEKSGKFTEFVEMACGKPAGWADSLEDESAYAVDALFRKLNDPRCDRFMSRQMSAVGTLREMAKKHGASMTSLLSQ